MQLQIYALIIVNFLSFKKKKRNKNLFKNLNKANNQARVIEFKGIDRILPLLNSPSVDIQRWAANAIGIICMDNGN